MKKLITGLYYTTTLGLLILGVALLGTLMPIPGNYKVKVVKSGSMEPSIRVGGIVVIQPASSYEIGDVITFGADTKTQIPTTHRIVNKQISASGIEFQTKGDANNAADPTPVKISDISGKVQVSVPYVGFVLAFARTPLGFILLVVVPALVVVLEELGAIWREIKRMRRKKGTPTQILSTPTVEVLPLQKTFQSVDGILPPGRSQLKHKQLVMGGVVLLIVGGLIAVPKLGETTARYMNVETSSQNKLQAAAVFDELPVVTLSATNAVVVPEPTPIEEAKDTAPVVELSEPVITITEQVSPESEQPSL